MNIENMAQRNLERLKADTYPGRGIVTGLSPSGRELVQIYWTMGRSANSKNRTMIRQDGLIKTVPYDKSIEVQNEELIIYNVARCAGKAHALSNGRQTDTIADYAARGLGFEQAMEQWSFETDPPIYTTRISTLALAGEGIYKLSVVKALGQNPELLSRQVFSYKAAKRGYGHCVHTYSADCAPFEGEPFWLPLYPGLDENAERYWEILAADKRVALYAKHIDIDSGEYEDRIITLKERV